MTTTRNSARHTSVKIAGAWTPTGAKPSLHANYGDGFKAPTLYELFSPYSNPLKELLPESARGWEVGGEQRAARQARAIFRYLFRAPHQQPDRLLTGLFRRSGRRRSARRGAVGFTSISRARGRPAGIRSRCGAFRQSELPGQSHRHDRHRFNHRQSAGRFALIRARYPGNAMLTWSPTKWSAGFSMLMSAIASTVWTRASGRRSPSPTLRSYPISGISRCSRAGECDGRTL